MVYLIPLTKYNKTQKRLAIDESKKPNALDICHKVINENRGICEAKTSVMVAQLLSIATDALSEKPTDCNAFLFEAEIEDKTVLAFCKSEDYNFILAHCGKTFN